MPPLRTFIAIELPAHIRASLEGITGRLQKAAAEVRWVKTADIHLTLKFLGTIEEERIPELTASIEQCIAGIAPFTVSVGCLGAFPNEHNPQVIWIGAREESGRLSMMHKALESGLARMGFKEEKRPFAPHLTLGRLKSPRGKGAARQGIEDFKSADCGSYEVGSICLFKSDLKPGGAVYTLLKSFSLVARS